MRFAALPVIALFGLGLALSGAGVAQADGAGAYLAARQAVIDGDHREAARYFDRAIAADPVNPAVLPNAILAHAANGDWARAAAIAARLDPEAQGRDLAHLVEQVVRLRNGDLSGALAAIEAGQGAGPLADDLMSGWLFLGAGDMRRTVATFEEIAAEGPLAQIARYHLALALAAVGDFEGADAIFSGATYGAFQHSARSLRAHAQVLVQLDRLDAALALLDETLAETPDPVLMALRAEIAAEPTRPYDFLVTAEQGVAEVLFSLARGLGTEGGAALPLIYSRAAFAINPDHMDAALLSAGLLADDDQPHLALEAYALIPEDSPFAVEAGMGRADALFALEREPEAIAAMQVLAAAHPDLASPQASLGDMLRRVDRYAEGAEAYSRALALVDTEQPRYWFLFYARAICLEREGRWDEAEADFRKALELNPDQPQVLNYLGYSLVEQKRNLDEALGMIQRAVAAEPQSGYIVDSLGWVLYRLGRYDEAVAPMERAAELLPNDPIVNDHLGDVYYKVGRHREARFQWLRAMSFDPEAEDAARILRKLEVGLTRVLEDEAAAGETQ